MLHQSLRALSHPGLLSLRTCLRCALPMQSCSRVKTISHLAGRSGADLVQTMKAAVAMGGNRSTISYGSTAPGGHQGRTYIDCAFRTVSGQAVLSW